MRATHSCSPTAAGGSHAKSATSEARSTYLPLHGGAVKTTSVPSAEETHEPHVALGAVNMHRPKKPLCLLDRGNACVWAAAHRSQPPRQKGARESVHYVDGACHGWGAHAAKAACKPRAGPSVGLCAHSFPCAPLLSVLAPPLSPFPSCLPGPAHLRPGMTPSQSRRWRRRHSLGRTSSRARLGGRTFSKALRIDST